jgi:hypothetical protein
LKENIILLEREVLKESRKGISIREEIRAVKSKFNEKSPWYVELSMKEVGRVDMYEDKVPQGKLLSSKVKTVPFATFQSCMN